MTEAGILKITSLQALMRFLLYPYRSVIRSKRRDAATTSASPVLAWGQQCSPTCGCVVRFEQNRDDNLNYTAKKVVTSGQKVVLTNKGRPMLTECNCSSLHRLSSALVDHYRTRDFKCRRSDLEFQSMRSSKAFRRTVLQSQGLPLTDGHCFDVVEEAWTAFIKGHIPSARREGPVIPLVQEFEREEKDDYVPEEHRPALPFSSDDHDDDHQYKLAISSTLRMFDWNQEQQEQIASGRVRRPAPSDWQSYVDQLNSERSA